MAERGSVAEVTRGLETHLEMEGQALLDVSSWTDLDHLSRERVPYTLTMMGMALAVGAFVLITFQLFVPVLGALLARTQEMGLAVVFEPAVWMASLLLPLLIFISLRVWAPKRQQERVLTLRGEAVLQSLARLLPYTAPERDVAYLRAPDGHAWGLRALLRGGGQIGLRVEDSDDRLRVEIHLDVPRDARAWPAVELPFGDVDDALRERHIDTTPEASHLDLLLDLPLDLPLERSAPLQLADLTAELLQRSGAPTSDTPPAQPAPFTRSADIQAEPTLDAPRAELTNPASILTFPNRDTGEARRAFIESLLRMIAWLPVLIALTLTSVALYQRFFVPVLERQEVVELALFAATPALCFVLFWGLRVSNRWRFIPRIRRRRVRYARDITQPVLTFGSRLRLSTTPGDGIDLDTPFSVDLSHHLASVDRDACWLNVVLTQRGERLGFRALIRESTPVTRDLPRAASRDPILDPDDFSTWVWPLIRSRAVLHGTPLAWSADA